MTLKELIKLKEELGRKKTEVAIREDRFLRIVSELRKEFGTERIEKAAEIVSKMQVDILEEAKQFTKEWTAFEAKWGDKLKES